jgi:hypothetical protein
MLFAILVAKNAFFRSLFRHGPLYSARQINSCTNLFSRAAISPKNRGETSNSLYRPPPANPNSPYARTLIRDPSLTISAI